MRLSLSLILLTAVASSAAELTSQGPIVRVLPATAGQAARIRTYGDHEGAVKVRFTVETPDGARRELPASESELPLPNGEFEGPTLPGGCGGGSLIVEIVDASTGETLSKGAAPIGF